MEFDMVIVFEMYYLDRVEVFCCLCGLQQGI